nr:hypothetical protein [uncultured Blautia sp.]
MSNAQRIKEYYKALLKDGRVHTRQELFEYVKTQDDSAYTNGMLSGALRSLVDVEPEYKWMGRGMYQMTAHSNGDCYADRLISNYVRILKNAVAQINKEEVDAFEILEFTEEDREKMKEVKNCIRRMENTIKKLEA